MAIRNKTIRKLPKASRKLARLINELDSTLTRLKHFLPDVETLEHDSNALYNRMSSYEKKAYAQEQAALENNLSKPESNRAGELIPESPGPLFDLNQAEQKDLSTEDKHEPAP
jgi:hypothetical protein